MVPLLKANLLRVFVSQWSAGKLRRPRVRLYERQADPPRRTALRALTEKLVNGCSHETSRHQAGLEPDRLCSCMPYTHVGCKFSKAMDISLSTVHPMNASLNQVSKSGIP